jgi:BTB And C-terminal Kelch
MDILTAALRWINHDRAHRMDHLTELMKIVRWVYFSQEELLQAVEFEKMLIQKKELKQLITDAQWYALYTPDHIQLKVFNKIKSSFKVFFYRKKRNKIK